MFKSILILFHETKGLFQWISLFRKILAGRGINSYGRSTLEHLVIRYMFEFNKPLEDLREAEKAIEELSSIFKTSNSTNLVRVGSTNDGGYILADICPNPTILSGGAGRNIEFEEYFVERNCTVHIYDPTIPRILNSKSNFTHFQKWLLGIPNKQKESMKLSQAFAELPKNSWHIYLKLDIEGSEIDLLEQELFLLREFDQIIIEFHDMFKLTDSKFRTDFMSVIHELDYNFNVVSVNSNNWKTFVNYGKAFIPEVFEVTFLRKDHVIEYSNLDVNGSMQPNLNNPSRLKIPNFPFIQSY